MGDIHVDECIKSWRSSVLICCIDLFFFLDLQHRLFVNIVSAEDGALSVLDATRTLCANVQSGDTKASHINSELVDNIIQGMHFR